MEALPFEGSSRVRKSSAFLPSSHAASSPWRPAGAPITGVGLSATPGMKFRLIPPAYVKPFVKRQKNDAADAEAIAEAASRPTMRFVAVKTEEQQARAMLFRTRGSPLSSTRAADQCA